MHDESRESYYRRRADQERRRAAISENNVAAAIHLDLAEAYEQRLAAAQSPATLAMVPRQSI